MAPDVGMARSPWAIVIVTLAIQFVLQSWFFPIAELFTATPLYYIDSPFHQYQMEVARQLCHQHALVGYDPFFAAGYLGGVTFNASAKVPALAACIVDNPDAVAAIYKVFSFAMAVLAPAAFAAAAVWLGLPRRATACAAVFGLLLWWTGPMRWYHTAGLVSYVAVAYGVIAFAAAYTCVCHRLTAPGVLGLALGALFGTLLHPLFAVAALLVCAPIVLLDVRGHGGWRRVAGVSVAVVAAVLVVDGPWLYASLHGPNFATVEQPYQRLVDPWLFVHEALGRAQTASAGSRLYLALLVGAGAALWLSSGPLRRSFASLWMASALLMLWASFGGLSKPIAALQPNRFSALAWLVLALPASGGTCMLLEQVRMRQAAWRRAAIAAGAIAIAALSLLFVREAAIEIFTQRPGRYAVAPPEVKGEGALSNALVAWLRANTDPSARVFLETSLARIHDRAHMAGIYALQTQREFIGGPYPFTDFASAWDGVAFGQPLQRRSPGELARYLDLYNVRWMLCHTSACRAAMEALPDTRPVAVIDTVTAYERRQQPGYFALGMGEVLARCVNRVEVSVQGAGPAVLKYHWVPGLVSDPPLTIEPLQVLDDPRPLIRIEHPVPRFAIGVGRPAQRCASSAEDGRRRPAAGLRPPGDQTSTSSGGG
ncbi:MAG TPA: hypothetical protein VMU47_14100 [Caldimonas sp.]|nr:hypothetical protein [Caldimonas sp.]